MAFYTDTNFRRIDSTVLRYGQGGSTKQVKINGDSEANADLVLESDEVSRWIIRKDATEETGSNAGSNFQIVARADNGALVLISLEIERQSGIVTIHKGVYKSEDGTEGATDDIDTAITPTLTVKNGLITGAS
jgi:hypothetical protein